MNEWLHLSNQSIIIILIILLSLDIYATNKTARFLKKHKPEIKHDEYEMNPIQVFLWNKFGVNPGSLIMGIYQVIVATLVYLFFPRDWVIMLIGMEILIAILHSKNLIFIIQKDRADKKAAYNKAIFNNESLF